MSTYVISDIHGCYKTFLKLLDNIKFTDNDKLYILGDIIDRGPESYELYQWVRNRHEKNVFMILGNHEDMFIENINVLKKFKKEFIDLNEKRKTIYFKNFFAKTAFVGNDHYGTIRQILKTQSADDILEMSDFFNKLPLFYKIEINNKEWILVHADCTFPLEKTAKDIFIWSRDLTTKGYGIQGKNIIFGHTPTICEEYNEEGQIQYEEGKIKSENYSKINIDCGCVFNRKNSCLGILRLDDLKPFYQKTIF